MALTVKQLLNYAWMSQASYLDFSGSRSFQDELKTSPINKPNQFTDGQAQAFTDPTDGFSFVSYAPNYQDTGFSATVFKSNADNSYTIAVRGTEPDTYIHKDDDGNDVIVDSDGDGSIIINGNTTLNGGTQVTGTDYVWQSADHTTYYTRFDQGNGKFTLNITLENKEKIFVKDWQDRKQSQVANENEWRVAA